MEIKKVKNKWQKQSPLREEIQSIYNIVLTMYPDDNRKSLIEHLDKIIAICEERGKY